MSTLVSIFQSEKCKITLLTRRGISLHFCIQETCLENWSRRNVCNVICVWYAPLLDITKAMFPGDSNVSWEPHTTPWKHLHCPSYSLQLELQHLLSSYRNCLKVQRCSKWFNTLTIVASVAFWGTSSRWRLLRLFSRIPVPWSVHIFYFLLSLWHSGLLIGKLGEDWNSPHFKRCPYHCYGRKLF